jgi:hypothetical protein
MSDPLSAREPRTIAMPSSSERRTSDGELSVATVAMLPRPEAMREMNTNETTNVAASSTNPMAPEPNVPKSRPAMPAPTTAPMSWEPCASELAAGSPSAGTILGRRAPRAGRK